MPQTTTSGDKVVRKTCMLLSCVEIAPLKEEDVQLGKQVFTDFSVSMFRVCILELC